ncbi:MAG: DUF6691 family protein [Planctomycetota bacterium]
MNPLVLGLLIGVAFGAILSLSGLSNPRMILDMLRLKDFSLFKLLVVAIGTGILGIALLASFELAHTSIKTLHLVAVLVGGGIFGAGFAITGYCPGTALAAAAEGRKDAFFAIAGGLAGTAVYAALYAALKPWLVDPLTFGKPTVHSWLGSPALTVALPVAGILAVVVWRWWSAEGRPAGQKTEIRGRTAS